MNKLLFSYLKYWATGYLKRVNPEIIAITGSVGKTSTKEAIFEVVNSGFPGKIRKSIGNLNNETGAPLAILNYSYSPKNILSWLSIIVSAPFKSFFLKKSQFLILELAADKPGDIKYLTSFIKPEIAVLTAIGPSHLEKFGSLEKIIEEKSEILKSLPASGHAVLNLDDPYVRKLSYGGRWQKITYAIIENANVMARSISYEIDAFKPKCKFKIKSSKNNFLLQQNNLGGKANVLASLAAVGVGEILSISSEKIKLGLEKLKPEKHRLNVVSGKNNSIIIDDSYNANPMSMIASLEIIRELPCKGKKIAVLGDMLEQGGNSEKAHKEIGNIARSSVDKLFSIGEEAKKYKANIHFENIEKAKKYLLENIQESDIILIKASRGIGLDRLVSEIRK